MTAPVPGRGDRPRVVVVAPRWESKTEEGWLTRQVAGALATVGDVHVVTPEGERPGTRTDSVFTLHRTGTPLDRRDERRRDLVVESLVRSGSGGGGLVRGVDKVLDGGVLEPWSATGSVVATLRPDRVVLAGMRNVGARNALGRAVPDVPFTLLALGSHGPSLACSHFDRVVAGADGVLVVTERERRALAERHGPTVDPVRIGAPLAANSSALNEPNTWVGATEYVLVVSGADSKDISEEGALDRLLRVRFPDRPVGVAHPDAFCAWHHGRLEQGWAIQRSSDMARLMAWAQVTVDLRGGPLFARGSVESLLFGTPIVVPADSLAREHAQGGGGLWFSTPEELTWCVEALFDPDRRAAFSAQGKAYAEAEYGSTGAFIERVLRGCRMSSPAASPPSSSSPRPAPASA